MQCAEDSPRTGAKTGSQPRNFLIGRNKLNSQGTSAQKSFDQDDGQGARRGQPVILDGLPCTSRDRDREVAASARCGSSGQQGCGFSLSQDALLPCLVYQDALPLT